MNAPQTSESWRHPDAQSFTPNFREQPPMPKTWQDRLREQNPYAWLAGAIAAAVALAVWVGKTNGHF